MKQKTSEIRLYLHFCSPDRIFEGCLRQGGFQRGGVFSFVFLAALFFSFASEARAMPSCSDSGRGHRSRSVASVSFLKKNPCTISSHFRAPNLSLSLPKETIQQQRCCKENGVPIVINSRLIFYVFFLKICTENFDTFCTVARRTPPAPEPIQNRLKLSKKSAPE